jgi:hypothetical protein
LDRINVPALGILPYFKDFGMTNFQCGTRICQKMHIKVTMTVYVLFDFFLHQILHMFLIGKEVNEDEIIPTDDMLFTKGQLNAARDGILLFTKWGNEKGESLANTVVPYSFDSGISKKEKGIVTNAVKKFNIDLKGCIHIV